MRYSSCSFAVLAVLLGGSASAHVGGHDSIHNTMANIIERLKSGRSADELRALTLDEAMAEVTHDERHSLASEYWSFTVNVPVTVWVARFANQPELPYWLEEEGYEKTADTVAVEGNVYEFWKKNEDAGRIGLGPNGFAYHANHYFVILTPQSGRGAIDVTDMYPGRHFVSRSRMNARVYRDRSSARIESIPDHLENQVLLIAERSRGRETQLLNIFRVTSYPATATPDQVVLTWSGDPSATQTVQWRTDTTVGDGVVQYRPAAGGTLQEVSAEPSVLEDEYLVNDPVNHRFKARIEGLNAATAYEYRVGSATTGAWSEFATFTTAPGEIVPFSFIYMGDVQNGIDTWGTLANRAFTSTPEAAFYILAGDLVNRGNERDDWDSFFHNSKAIFAARQLVPALGNHEYQGENGPWMYQAIFDLLKNGPDTIDPQCAYSFEYSNAIFIILDSNLPPASQADWLDAQLANTSATWKFVVYHHPAYSSSPRRDNPLVRTVWGDIFDKYHVDLALQGHDHAYLRTYPMKGEQRVDSPAEGTIYIVSVAGTKYYEQDPRDYTEVGMTNVSTYQVLDIEIDGNKLTYRAYDVDGEIRDEFVIEK